MTSQPIPPDSPLALIIAADARLSRTNYSDDQIWELRLSGGEPPALALETTYGLRAQRVRIFPRFILNDVQRSDPASFFSPPRVVSVYPNYVLVSFFPFEELEVLAEYWIPDSHVAAGRLRLSNHSVLPLNFRLELTALLAGRDRQGGLSPLNLGGSADANSGEQALTGETANLSPVLYLSGAPHSASGPYPALALDFNLYPGNLRICTWAMAGLSETQAALQSAQQVTARNWDAESARMELLNRSQTVLFDTGNPDWDATLAMAQKSALGLFMHGQSDGPPHTSFVLTRRPDQGYSARGDGSDHPLTWAGPTALDATYLASLLPGAPDLLVGVLRNFMAAQDEEGRIDWRPGLGAQRTHRLAQPVLASLALHLADRLAANRPPSDAPSDLLSEVYPGLLRFFEHWLRPEHDGDGDGVPEWENALQTGIEDSPIFDRFSHDARGTDANRVESPGLTAMLYRECTSLMRMARALGPSAAAHLPALSTVQEHLRDALDETWNDTASLYTYRDYQSHLSLAGVSMVSFQGSGQFSTKRRFKQPRRLVIRLEAYEERTYAATFTLTGITPQGEVTESIGPRSFGWLGAQAHAVTQNTYLSIERIEVLGLGPRDRGRVYAPDLTQEDCSLLLPLWAGACSPERASQLVQNSLLPHFRRPFGIAITPDAPSASDRLPRVSMLWNHLLGEGLLRYGFRAEAGALMESLLSAATATLKRENNFRQWHHADTGQPGGEPGHLHGIPPVGLFLRVLGIQQLGSQQILLDGFNPYPSPVTVQYRRVKIICHSDHTDVSVAGGTPVSVDRPGPHRLIL